MELPVNEQMLSAVMALLCGVLFGFVYDFLKALRLKAKNCVVTSLCDVIVCLVGAALLVFLTMEATGGKLRVYIALTTAVGTMAYFLCLSRYILRIFTKFFELMVIIIKKLNSVLVVISKGLKKLGVF